MEWWEKEEAWFAADGLLFSLDRATMQRDGAVVFRGLLRRGKHRCAATIVYPEAYTSGEHPVVLAPALPITRHKGPDGTLCLDHPIGSQVDTMTGPEAALRAEELWRLSVEDPDGLRAAEADAPDPRIDHYDYALSSAIVMIDADVRGYARGYVRLGLSSLSPTRGALAGLGTDDAEFPVTEENLSFAGPVRAPALWRRLDAPPPGPGVGALSAWAQSRHADLLTKAQALAAVQRIAVPAMVAFVFPDEGPARGEYHDAWIVLAVMPDGERRLVRCYPILRAEHWRRQPQLEALGGRAVAVIGAGALGSQIAALLARAGLGRCFLVDHDVVTPGNRVRHELDLGDVGAPKVEALARRLKRINPYMTIGWHAARFGGPSPQAELRETVTDCDLIVNATANIATGYHISAVADAAGRPVAHVAVGSGAWGARVLLQRHGVSGCLECLARRQADGGEIPELPADPEHPEVLDQGCAQASFTGPGFELTSAAAAAARLAVQALLDGDGYPATDYDLATLTLRGRQDAQYTRLPRHPECQSCTSPAA
jgi:molybdopterin/thiamine biosynthesis adenylyltransferase